MASPREQAERRRLERLDEPERFRAIFRHFGHEPDLGLRLAKSLLDDRKHFLLILRYGLENAGPSRVGDYLDCCQRALGRPTLVDEIDAFAGPSNPTVRAAFRHLGLHLSEATA